MRYLAKLFCTAALLSLAVGRTHAAVDDGLIVYLTFDSVAGDTIEDASGGGHDGVMSAGAAVVEDEVALGTGALRIEGGDNRVEVASFAALEEYQDNTYLFWILFPDAATGGWDQILAKPAPGSDRSPGLWVHTGGLGIHYRYEPGNQGFSAFGPEGDDTHFEMNQWYHVAAVTSAGELNGYVDGVSKATIAVPPAFAQGDGGLFIGNSPAYGGPAANFYLDDLAVYNRALAADEIGSVMDGELLVSVSPRGMLTTKWAALRR
ncbi:MAG: LamG domain-containing protein [Candidatus Poribacteria bacterium]